jgi:AcrR family transcriptional regulator
MAEPAASEPSRRPRRTQAERRAIAERELLAAALRLVAERGIGRTTLADVGVAAGYSRALPAVYFRDKAGLIRALWDHVAHLFNSRVHLFEKRQKGLDAVLGLVELYLTRSDEDPVVFRASQVLLIEAFSAAPEIRDSAVQHNRNSEQALARQIRAGIERGEIRSDVDPGAQAILIIAALRGALSRWIIDPSVNLSRVRKEMVSSLRRSLAP